MLPKDSAERRLAYLGAAGTSVLTIRETQHRSWGADGTLTVTSDPVLDFVGGSKFTTRAEFVLRPDGDGCRVGRCLAWSIFRGVIQDEVRTGGSAQERPNLLSWIGPTVGDSFRAPRHTLRMRTLAE